MCFRRKYLKTSENRGCGNFLKKYLKKEVKEKGKLNIYCLHYI